MKRAEPFHGTFPKLGPPTAVSGKVHQKFAASVNSAHMILAGYEHNINEVRQTLTFRCFNFLSIFSIILYAKQKSNFVFYGA